MSEAFENSDLTSSENLSNYLSDEHYLIVLKSIADDMKLLEELLPEFAEHDLEMFRIKTHGIKGVTKQIGLLEFSNYADEMQLAAKRADSEYVNKNLYDFILTMKDTREELLERIKKLSNNTVEECVDTIEEWKHLKNAFLQYDYGSAESSIKSLEAAKLDSYEKEILEKVRIALRDMDYELGIILASQVV